MYQRPFTHSLLRILHLLVSHCLIIGLVVNIPTTVFCEVLEPSMGHMHNQVTEKGKCLDDVVLRKAKTIAANQHRYGVICIYTVSPRGDLSLLL